MRRKHFAIADGSLHEDVGVVDLAAAMGAVDPERAALGAKTLRLLRGLTRLRWSKPNDDQRRDEAADQDRRRRRGPATRRDGRRGRTNERGGLENTSHL